VDVLTSTTRWSIGVLALTCAGLASAQTVNVPPAVETAAKQYITQDTLIAPLRFFYRRTQAPAAWEFEAKGQKVDLKWSDEYIVASGAQKEQTKIEDAELVFVDYGRAAGLEQGRRVRSRASEGAGGSELMLYARPLKSALSSPFTTVTA
jgi:hypothetical protein